MSEKLTEPKQARPTDSEMMWRWDELVSVINERKECDPGGVRNMGLELWIGWEWFKEGVNFASAHAQRVALEQAKQLALSEPRVFEPEAPDPQHRIAAKIQALIDEVAK